MRGETIKLSRKVFSTHFASSCGLKKHGFTLPVKIPRGEETVNEDGKVATKQPSKTMSLAQCDELFGRPVVGIEFDLEYDPAAKDDVAGQNHLVKDNTIVVEKLQAALSGFSLNPKKDQFSMSLKIDGETVGARELGLLRKFPGGAGKITIRSAWLHDVDEVEDDEEDEDFEDEEDEEDEEDDA